MPPPTNPGPAPSSDPFSPTAADGGPASTAALGGGGGAGADAAAAATTPPRTPTPTTATATTTATVSFPNDRGDTLVGTLTAPPGATRVAVLCHGFRDSKEAPLLAAIASALAAVGVASLRLDFRGCGGSGGVWAFGNYVEEAADVGAAVGWLRSPAGAAAGAAVGAAVGVKAAGTAGAPADDGGDGRPWEVVAVAGHSKGAGSVLLYASREAYTGLVVNIAGRFHMREGVQRRLGEERWAALWREGAVAMPGYTVTVADVEARFALDMGAEARGLDAGATLLTIHGDGDEVIPVADAAAYGAVVPPPRHTVVVVPGACHKFVEYRERVAGMIADAVVARFG